MYYSTTLPLQFIHMRVELWANHMGIKLRCYWECLQEQLQNLGTSREYDENMLRTNWEQENQK
jgi:hypothetical protein